MGGASSETEDGLPPKDKEKAPSEHSLASFNNLQIETRDDQTKKAGGTLDRKISKIARNVTLSGEQGEKAKEGGIQGESPYHHPEPGLLENSNESR